MKRILAIMMILAVLTCCSAVAETKITVTGYGKVTVPADTATINLGVTEYADNAIDAQSMANEKIAAIRAACIESGIPESNISISGINLTTLMDYNESSTPIVTGYNASSSLTICLYDIEKTGSAIDTAILAGANVLNEISFSLKDSSVYNEQVINAACIDAQEKAELYANSLDLTITGIASVGDTYSDSYENSGSSFELYSKDYTPTDVSSGSVVVYATASFTFTAE